MNKLGLFLLSLMATSIQGVCAEKDINMSLNSSDSGIVWEVKPQVQSPNQKIPDRKTKCVIKTHINIKQNVIFGAKLKPV
jgi:hypothetical protein